MYRKLVASIPLIIQLTLSWWIADWGWTSKYKWMWNNYRGLALPMAFLNKLKTLCMKARNITNRNICNTVADKLSSHQQMAAHYAVTRAPSLTRSWREHSPLNGVSTAANMWEVLGRCDSDECWWWSGFPWAGWWNLGRWILTKHLSVCRIDLRSWRHS